VIGELFGSGTNVGKMIGWAEILTIAAPSVYPSNRNQESGNSTNSIAAGSQLGAGIGQHHDRAGSRVIGRTITELVSNRSIGSLISSQRTLNNEKRSRAGG
jgi:hypothetical protein